MLDAWITLAWPLPNELTDEVQAVFEAVLNDAAQVPPLWRLGVANSLSISVRRQRITKVDRDLHLKDLLDLPIVDDVDGATAVWNATLKLADQHKLTIYDATYLELALRLSLPLATLDEDLRRAAKAEKVPLLGL